MKAPMKLVLKALAVSLTWVLLSLALEAKAQNCISQCFGDVCTLNCTPAEQPKNWFIPPPSNPFGGAAGAFQQGYQNGLRQQEIRLQREQLELQREQMRRQYEQLAQQQERPTLGLREPREAQGCEKNCANLGWSQAECLAVCD